MHAAYCKPRERDSLDGTAVSKKKLNASSTFLSKYNMGVRFIESENKAKA
jgi:hypothetical protein